jgi:hypothetical protein
MSSSKHSLPQATYPRKIASQISCLIPYGVVECVPQDAFFGALHTTSERIHCQRGWTHNMNCVAIVGDSTKTSRFSLYIKNVVRFQQYTCIEERIPSLGRQLGSGYYQGNSGSNSAVNGRQSLEVPQLGIAKHL